MARRGGGRRVQRAGAGRSPVLAPGGGAPRVREVPAAGGHHVQPGLHRVGAAREHHDHPPAGQAVRVPVRPAPPQGRGGAQRGHRRGDPRRPRRGRQPRPRPDHALLPGTDPGDAAEVPDLPAPRPKYELWVYSPRFEAVHLRFGDVARGGLRWSDRREDFRTEILGLAKAQEVKNAVIVPSGAKGGFVCKQLPADRQAQAAEVLACYRMFISAMLDVTDNLVDSAVVPPQDVVRRDGDDPYLVVAADKGTATFSDEANAIAASRGFWLGDAFASGGSQGYDHKKMGITARGAWESVKFHFQTIGID